MYATSSTGRPSPHSTTGLPTRASGTPDRSTVSMSIDTRPASGTTLPQKLITRLEVAAENTDVVETIGIDWALTQIRDLLAQGAPGYHLYILNRAKGALALTAGLAA